MSARVSGRELIFLCPLLLTSHDVNDYGRTQRFLPLQILLAGAAIACSAVVVGSHQAGEALCQEPPNLYTAVL